MKNKFFTVLGLTLALAVVSCNKDDDAPKSSSAQVETAKVSFNVVNPSSTAKSVDVTRGDIPMYVDNLTINAVSKTLNPFVASENFTFSPAGTQSGLSLPNVALGTNTFSATSTSPDANKVCSLTIDSEDWDVIRQKGAYIPCFSKESAPVVIKKTGNDKVNLEMTTNHGRILGRITQESPDASRYWVLLRVTAAGASVPTGIISLPDGSIRPEDWQWPVTFQWSNEKAVHGAEAVFTFTIYEKPENGVWTGNVNGLIPLNTIVKTVAIEKGKSKICNFRIYNEDVHTDLVSGGIGITFPTIVDETVPDSGI